MEHSVKKVVNEPPNVASPRCQLDAPTQLTILDSLQNASHAFLPEKIRALSGLIKRAIESGADVNDLLGKSSSIPPTLRVDRRSFQSSRSDSLPKPKIDPSAIHF